MTGKNLPISLVRGTKRYKITWRPSRTFQFTSQEKRPEKKKELNQNLTVLRLEKLLNEALMSFWVFSQEFNRPVVQSENSRVRIPFKVMGDTNAQKNDKVLVKFVRWDPPARIPSCKILRVLGPGHDAHTDHKGILFKYGLSQTFPA